MIRKILNKDAIFITKYVWQSQRMWIILLVVLTVLQGVIPAGIAIVTRELVNQAGQLNNANNAQPFYYLLLFGVFLGLLAAIVALFTTFAQTRLRFLLSLDITNDLMIKISQLDVAQVESKKMQDLLSRVERYSTSHIIAFVPQLLQIGKLGLQLVSLALIMVALDGITVIVLLMFSIPYLVFQRSLQKRHHQLETERTLARRRIRYNNSLITDYRSVPEVKLLNLHPHLIDETYEQTKLFIEQDYRFQKQELVSGVFFVLLAMVVILGVSIRMVNQLIAGDVSIGDIVTYFIITLQLRSSLQSLVSTLSIQQEALLYINDFRKLMKVNVARRINGITSIPSQQAIRFENIYFRYPDTDMNVLNDMTFTIDPGETVAIVGANGSGKSTIVKLLAGIYQPTQGNITWGQHNISQFDLKSWQSQISFVFQDFNRYETTVAQNIGYGDWNKLYDNDQAILSIGKEAGVEQIANRLPDGYSTRIGRYLGDTNLSSGQWQRIAVARAAARKDSKLLILDEPTASLDAQAEYELFQQFKELAKGRSTILISHRFSTLSFVDRLIVLSEGRIIEQGTHEDLLAINGMYAKLFQMHKNTFK